MKDYTEQIDNNFISHSLDEEQLEKLEDIRNDCRSLASLINDYVPNGREKSIALTNLEEVMFWANAGIARK